MRNTLYKINSVDLNKQQELSLIAHRMASEHPDKEATWYAIGCYWYAKGEFEAACKCFSKTRGSLDGCAAFGHTFARRNEHDQAIAAYRMTFRLHPAAPQIPMFLGMELLKQGEFGEASSFFNISLKLDNSNPFLYNECGMYFFMRGE